MLVILQHKGFSFTGLAAGFTNFQSLKKQSDGGQKNSRSLISRLSQIHRTESTGFVTCKVLQLPSQNQFLHFTKPTSLPVILDNLLYPASCVPELLYSLSTYETRGNLRSLSGLFSPCCLCPPSTQGCGLLLSHHACQFKTLFRLPMVFS